MGEYQKLVLQQAPEDKTAVRSFVDTTMQVWWASRETGPDGAPLCSRRPQEATAAFSSSQGFTAAGKHYSGIQELHADRNDLSNPCLDIYGRRVLCFSERFPCFDSYDYLYENRHYRWFYLCDGEKLTLIYCADGRPTVKVTEDVAAVPVKWWSAIEKLCGG